MPDGVIFFDLGDTLGVGGANASGIITGFEPFPFVKQVLKQLSDSPPAGLGRRLGVISNTPAGNTTANMASVLTAAGIFGFFDPGLLLYSSVEEIDKTNPALFKRAASRAAQPVSKCIFVGENAKERKVAASTGMMTSFHPLHVFHVLKTMS